MGTLAPPPALSEQLTFTLRTSAVAVPEPLLIEQVWPVGWVFTVTE